VPMSYDQCSGGSGRVRLCQQHLLIGMATPSGQAELRLLPYKPRRTRHADRERGTHGREHLDGSRQVGGRGPTVSTARFDPWRNLRVYAGPVSR
jgi:hypothetical protein